MRQHKHLRRHALLNLSKKALKTILIKLGVSSIPAGIATHFIFRYIFRPIALHLMKKKMIHSYKVYVDANSGILNTSPNYMLEYNRGQYEPGTESDTISVQLRNDTT